MHHTRLPQSPDHNDRCGRGSLEPSRSSPYHSRLGSIPSSDSSQPFRPTRTTAPSEDRNQSTPLPNQHPPQHPPQYPPAPDRMPGAVHRCVSPWPETVMRPVRRQQSAWSGNRRLPHASLPPLGQSIHNRSTGSPPADPDAADTTSVRSTRHHRAIAHRKAPRQTTAHAIDQSRHRNWHSSRSENPEHAGRRPGTHGFLRRPRQPIVIRAEQS